MEVINSDRFSTKLDDARDQVQKSYHEWFEIYAKYPFYAERKKMVEGVDDKISDELRRLLDILEGKQKMYFFTSPWEFFDFVHKCDTNPTCLFNWDLSFTFLGVTVFQELPSIGIYVPTNIDNAIRYKTVYDEYCIMYDVVRKPPGD